MLMKLQSKSAFRAIISDFLMSCFNEMAGEEHLKTEGEDSNSQ